MHNGNQRSIIDSGGIVLPEVSCGTVTAGNRIDENQGFELGDDFWNEVFGRYSWKKVDCTIYGSNGSHSTSIFGEFPDFWSRESCVITSSKYFRVKGNKRENSLKQVVRRVVEFIVDAGYRLGYFAFPLRYGYTFLSKHEDAAGRAREFATEIAVMLIEQKMSFNSPVWFNVGITKNPQTAACFLLKVEDNMQSILEWIRTEGLIFKGGSGSGINVSTLRSSREYLSSGGKSSGPVAFMRAADAVAGAIKSGGATRRAAKMVVMDVTHPDILDFIRCKAREEKKAHLLISAGLDKSIDGEAYQSVAFQNANHSVRVSDDFMRAVENNAFWRTKLVTTGEVADVYEARYIMREIAEAAWICGDPGMQFDDTINRWHTCPSSGRINTSNPCSEVMHLDNSCCNLASLNLLKFLVDGRFDTVSFMRSVAHTIVAQDILVDVSSYPTAEIAENAHNYRQLGIGFSNLGSLLMSIGVPYDSDYARNIAASIAALLTGTAYSMSAGMAAMLGRFAGMNIGENFSSMLNVIRMHKKYAEGIVAEAKSDNLFFSNIIRAAMHSWESAEADGALYGFRNAQVSAIAPTGTISFMMGCSTTGIEPELSIVKEKFLVGGGIVRMVNDSVGPALRSLGYSEEDIKSILSHIEDNKSIFEHPALKKEHYDVFDCALPQGKENRQIKPMAHVKMVAAVQPFISGAISKTVNMPSSASVDDIIDIYMSAWKLGVKAIAVYRDGCKMVQPLKQIEENNRMSGTEREIDKGPVRRRMPIECNSIRHKFSIAGHDGYMHIGLFDDGSPGELFVRVSKEGSTISGLMDAIGILTSMALQYGVPLEDMVKKLSYMSFEPSGFTGRSDIPYARSIVDYIFRYLGNRFVGKNKENSDSSSFSVPTSGNDDSLAGRACSVCGAILRQSGTCFVCANCGTTTGGCS